MTPTTRRERACGLHVLRLGSSPLGGLRVLKGSIGSPAASSLQVRSTTSPPPGELRLGQWHSCGLTVEGMSRRGGHEGACRGAQRVGKTRGWPKAVGRMAAVRPVTPLAGERGALEAAIVDGAWRHGAPWGMPPAGAPRHGMSWLMRLSALRQREPRDEEVASDVCAGRRCGARARPEGLEARMAAAPAWAAPSRRETGGDLQDGYPPTLTRSGVLH